MRKVLKFIGRGDRFPGIEKGLITFFDLDHTLINKNCSASFGSFLYRKGEMSFFKAVLLISFYYLHKWKLISLKRLHDWSFGLLFKGKEKERFSKLAFEHVKKVFSEQQCGEMTRLLEKAREKGEVHIVSASPDFIVRVYAEHFNVHRYFATEYGVDAEGRFDRIGEIVVGAAKRDYAKSVINGRYSVGYSDDECDLPLLTSVNEGYLVEP